MAELIERIERLIIIEGKYINPDKIVCIESLKFGDDPAEAPKAYITFNGGSKCTMVFTSPTKLVEILKQKCGVKIEVS